MNLPFTITHDELRDLFSRFGEIEDTEVPLRRGGTGFGFAFIRFATIEGAIGAFAELDKTYFQGRKLHILPAQAKPPKPIEELAIIPEEEVLVPIENAEEAVQQASEKPVEQTPQRDKVKQSKFKEEKEKELRTNFDDELNWNYLYMNQDSVATAMARKLNVEKGALLDRNQANLAVRLAKAETIIIQQTKEWLKDRLGVNLDELDRTARASCKRSYTSLLIKNVPANAKEEELKEVFERYAVLKNLELGLNKTLALADSDNEKQAKAAMKSHANHKLNYIITIYHEYAPLCISKDSKSQKKHAASQKEEVVEEVKVVEELDDQKKQERTLFVKNLNFSTTDEMLEQIFKEDVGAAKQFKVISCKVVRNTKTQLSRGYGFVELDSRDAAERAIKKF